MMNMLHKGKVYWHMETFDTFYGLKLAYLIFAAAEQFAINLQTNQSKWLSWKVILLLSLHLVFL